MLELFIILQSILLLIMLFHDWVPLGSLNDLDTLFKTSTKKKIAIATGINTLFVLIPLSITLYYYPEKMPSTAHWIIVFFYFALTVGTILSWWIPYFFGSSDAHKKHFQIFHNTHHFLPKRGDHVVPNTLHVILHLIVWSCFVLALLQD